MHSSVSCFSVQQSGSHWVSICPCWLIIFGGNFGEFVMLSELFSFSCCCLPVQCSVSWENPDAFWESLGHGCTIRNHHLAFSGVWFFILLSVWEMTCVCVLKSLTCQRCTETVLMWKWQFHSPLPFLGRGNWTASLCRLLVLFSAVVCPGGWGQVPPFCGCHPTPACPRSRYMSRPVMSGPGLYDPTTIMNADILAYCQKEGWCKLAFYLLSFFYYLYG